MTKEEKRNYKMDLRIFLHGIMEHILQKKKYSTRNGALKKQKFEDEMKAEESSFS
jgi:hypothetical protein